MNRDDLNKELVSLRAKVVKESEYIVYRFDSENDSNLSLLIYLYNDNEASFNLEISNDPEIYTAYKAYEKTDYENESSLFSQLLSDLTQALEQGIECHAKNGFLFHHSKALLADSKAYLFGSSAFKFSNFKLPNKYGVVGVFQAKA